MQEGGDAVAPPPHVAEPLGAGIDEKGAVGDYSTVPPSVRLRAPSVKHHSPAIA